MKKLFWLTVGIFAGIEIKKQIDKNPNAQALVADVTARAKEFGEIASESFLDRTAELTGTPRSAKVRKAPKKPSSSSASSVRKAPAKKPSSSNTAAKK